MEGVQGGEGVGVEGAGEVGVEGLRGGGGGVAFVGGGDDLEVQFAQGDAGEERGGGEGEGIGEGDGGVDFESVEVGGVEEEGGEGGDRDAGVAEVEARKDFSVRGIVEVSFESFAGDLRAVFDYERLERGKLWEIWRRLENGVA